VSFRRGARVPAIGVTDGDVVDTIERSQSWAGVAELADAQDLKGQRPSSPVEKQQRVAGWRNWQTLRA
jgi:hypothetical protein